MTGGCQRRRARPCRPSAVAAISGASPAIPMLRGGCDVTPLPSNGDRAAPGLDDPTQVLELAPPASARTPSADASGAGVSGASSAAA